MKKAQTFNITGSVELLEAITKRLTALGYKLCKGHSITPDTKQIGGTIVNVLDYVTVGTFKQLYAVDSVKLTNNVSFTLPQDYDKAVAFAEEQLKDKYWTEEKIVLPFASLEFTIDKKSGTATCEHGTITKAEIKQVIDWHYPNIHLLKFKMEKNIGPVIKFGCQQGTLAEAEAIYRALNS